MISELTMMELASDQQKIQKHTYAHFPCSAYYTKWKEGGIKGVPWHWHNELELMYVVKGKAEVFFGSEKAFLQEGDGYFVNTRSFHRIDMTGCSTCQVRSFVFDPVLVSGNVETIFDEKYIQPLITVNAFPGCALYDRYSSHHMILEHIKKAHHACEHEQDAFEYDVRYHLSKALYYIYQNNEQLLREKREIVVNSRRTRVMLDYIHSHYDEVLTIADLANEGNICEREVQRCFRKDLNLSPISYIQHYRIHMACRKIMESRQPITEIGLACGFSNASHFCRIFRKHMCCSPQEFRRNNS